LSWRQPVLLWTPAAIALALGWPAILLREAPALSLTALIGGAIVFAASFVTMGAAWASGRAPRTRRDVLQHFLASGAVVAIGAPFVLAGLLNAVAEAEHAVTGLRAASPYALTPLALVLGLPIAFFYGLAFSLVALVKPPSGGDPKHDRRSREARKHEVQPFV
jgi:hypothetical protein